DFVVTDPIGGEVHVDEQARNGILLEATFRHEEIVDHVDGPQGDVQLLIYRKHQGAGDDVVFSGGIVGIDAQGVAGGGIFQFGLAGAVVAIRAGIAEVPLELHSGDLDLLSAGSGALKAGLGPNLGSQEADT